MSAIPLHIASFQSLRGGAQGDPHALADERLKVLWVLATISDDPEFAYLSPAQVSDILRDVEGIDIPRQRVSVILDRETGTVARKRKGGKKQYRIMKLGSAELDVSALTSVFVDPERAFTEIRRFEDILQNMSGDLKICDPYLENKSLDFIAECVSAKSISLLTANVLKETKFRRDFAAYQKEHKVPIEVRVAAPGLLHDRYILHNDGMLLLGTSLNGFAKKQSFIVTLGPDIRSATEAAFNRFWANSTKF